MPRAHSHCCTVQYSRRRRAALHPCLVHNGILVNRVQISADVCRAVGSWRINSAKQGRDPAAGAKTRFLVPIRGHIDRIWYSNVVPDRQPNLVASGGNLNHPSRQKKVMGDNGMGVAAKGARAGLSSGVPASPDPTVSVHCSAFSAQRSYLSA